MSRIITKRIIPILLLVMLCIGMFPTAFAEEEIMIADTPAATQIEVVQDSSDADITIVPNEDAGDLIADEGPDSAPVDESSSSGADFSSTGSSEVPAPSSSEASSPSCAVSDSAISSSSEIVIPDSSSTSSTSVVSADESETIPEETGTSDEKVPAETSVEIVRMRGASLLSASAASAGKLSWTKHPEYQYDASQGLSSVDMQPWPTATINGQIAYCVQPENLNTHGSKPYAPIQYDHLSSTQRYAIGYAMLYGAQDTGNIPFHIATQTIIWEIVHGYMDLESFTAINKTAYNAVIGYNPAAAPYYEQILAQMRSHKEVPSFTHFFSALAPVHQMSGIPGEYKLDLVNTNPNCDLNDFNFAEQADVFFVKDIRVNMLLEEFCNVYLPSASRLLSVVRSRNIACQLLVQSVAQLQDRYPQGEWEEIVSNCSTQLVLGVNDVTTATYISKKCGIALWQRAQHVSALERRDAVSQREPGQNRIRELKEFCARGNKGFETLNNKVMERRTQKGTKTGTQGKTGQTVSRGPAECRRFE